MVRRQMVASTELRQILVEEATRILGHSASFLAPHMKISRRPAGEPNWDAKLDIFGGALLTGVFHEANEHVKALYDLE
jgi:hypothetical protein